MKIYNHKQLLLSSVITMGIISPANLISQPLTNPKINEFNSYSNKSFITKAVEKTGSSVVTIDTQRYVKKRKIPRNSQLFIDPYFERLFGLDLPKDTKPRIEQSQGSGFIFADGSTNSNWELSVWVSNKAFANNRAYNTLLHETSHAFSYLTRNCVNPDGVNQRKNAQGFFGSEELFADALVLYYGGDYVYYRDNTVLSNTEIEYLAEYIALCYEE